MTLTEEDGPPDLDAVLIEVCEYVETVSGQVLSPETKATLVKLIRKSADAGVRDADQLKTDAIAALPHCIPANGGA